MRTFLYLFFIAASSMTACDTGPNGSASSGAVVAEATTVQLSVQGMTCTGCEQAITSALLQLPGVTEAGADHQAGSAWAKVAAGGAAPATMASTVSELGYTASVAKP